MVKNRVEIYRDSVWTALDLYENRSIKYNALINKIEGINSREISHTNTFSLPRTEINITALGINDYNKIQLAQALNSRYEAKYYVNDKLIRKGYLIVNNSLNGTINVNFLDNALDLIEKWNITSFRDFIQDETKFPSDLRASLLEMDNYDMSQSSVLTPLSEIGSRGYNLAYFPNNLNCIGDKFQVNDDGLRIDNTFNPYQSRPIFNAKAFIDLIVEGNGYTSDFDASIDLDRLESIAIVSKELGKSPAEDSTIQEVEYNSISASTPYYSRTRTLGNDYEYENYTAFVYGFDNLGAKRPQDIANFVTPSILMNGSLGALNLSQYSIWKPSLVGGFVGSFQMRCDANGEWTEDLDLIALAIYENNSSGGDTLYKAIAPTTDNSDVDNPPGTVDLTFDKADLEVGPTNSNDVLIGVLLVVKSTYDDIDGATGNAPYNIPLILTNLIASEQAVPSGIVGYDKYGQFVNEEVDLRYAASRETLKSLLMPLLAAEGILLNINTDTEVVKFFTYGKYDVERAAGNFEDWSDYILNGTFPRFNTEYGNSYGQKNSIGLSDPYLGNTKEISILNQLNQSKLKEYAENYSRKFADVSNIDSIDNSNTPYFEYTNEGLGLVQKETSLGSLNQINATGTTQGAFTGLNAFANLNFAAEIPGVESWYKIIESSVKVEDQFLLPLKVIKELDLSIPIYIMKLGGFYFIEEIQEYTDDQTPVEIKLIRLNIDVSIPTNSSGGDSPNV